MFKKFVFALTALIVGFTAFVAMRPATYRVERSLTMATPVDLPFGLVNDFHRWHFWSPWDALDPKMKKTFDGPYAGPGAIYSWSGNEQAGQGTMTILDARPYESIHIQLEFLKPWPSKSNTTFTFEPVAEGVTVRWTMEGTNNFMGKAFSLFMDMDGMIGQDFEKGLATIKTLTETEAKNRLERQAALEAKAEAEAATRAAQPTEAPQANTATP
ncbi:SRPBCC family protein [Archangium sp.]|uniref:SRPBCC family protein n=1 Tax=Archangium sp. TaxID=1872627 RepID=UPI00286CB99B|nr:SRPBCC family protein [Archangium sp.]